jgi:hypothetical protein
MNVILAGNGLSIAYNPELALESLSAKVRAAFDAAGLGDADLLARFAAQTGATDSGLESMLGALDQVAAALRPLSELATLAALGAGGQQSVRQAAEALGQVYRVGAGVALQTIDGLARGQDDADRAAQTLLAAIPSNEPLTVASLNYDGILPSRLLSGGGFHDLAAGYESSQFEVVRGKSALACYPLRTHDDMDSRSVLLNLHGFLGWLWHPDHRYWRFSLEDLREVDYWTALRTGTTKWLPAVVLTNQQIKSELVRQHPFSLAYEAFVRRLRMANRLVVAGYSFSDEYLNERLQAAVRQHDELSPTTPLKIAVIDKGNALTDETIYETLPRRASTNIFREGVNGAVVDARWTQWAF